MTISAQAKVQAGTATPAAEAPAPQFDVLLNFLVRAAAIRGIGLLADQWGLTSAFMWSAALALLSIPAVWWLPQTVRPATQA